MAAEAPEYSGIAIPNDNASSGTPFHDELIATARAIAKRGRGILAADESTGTIGKRFAGINVENNQANRRAYRQLLITSPGWGDFCSGIILFEESLFEETDDGRKFVDIIREAGVIPGIKTDKGVRKLPGSEDGYTQGLTDLDVRCKKYYAAGARFCKWRAVLTIRDGRIGEQSIQETAWTLARYAAISQDNGLAPIVEPEILMDGSHTIETCRYWTEKTLAACYKALRDNNVLLEGTLLKPNMVCPGKDCPTRATPEEVARHTVLALQRTVPASVPGITFLSGGQTEEEATNNLNAMNALDLGPRPWSLTFSYGRALQGSCLAAWQGKPENIVAAQKALLIRARANSMAQKGIYDGNAASEAAQADLFERNYTY